MLLPDNVYLQFHICSPQPHRQNPREPFILKWFLNACSLFNAELANVATSLTIGSTSQQVDTYTHTHDSEDSSGITMSVLISNWGNVLLQVLL